MYFPKFEETVACSCPLLFVWLNDFYNYVWHVAVIILHMVYK